MTKSKRQKLKKKAAKRQEAEALLSEKAKKNEYFENLIVEAEVAVDSFNYDEAEHKLNEVLSSSPDNVKALEMLAGIHMEKNSWNEAHNLLKKCVQLSPENGFSKYFSLGQLSDGEEAVTYYQKGIKIAERELENSENVEPSEDNNRKSIIRSLSDAYCSISEIFMTDCCFAENAESNCLNAIEMALKVDPMNPEAFQCLSNFHLVKENVNEAKVAVEKCLSLWLNHHEALRDGEAEDVVEHNIPSYDCRIKISKLLIELNMFDEATKVLDGLIEEDDEVVEVWYLLGWMNYIQGDDYKLNAHYYLNKAKKVSVKTGLEGFDYIEHIHELLDELKSIVSSDEDEEESVENDEWETDLTSDSENENNMET